ncbi:MAG: dihydrolipoyl dehydrogenase [Chloroflexi bacterium]|nr:dihydrolipoyl dehydrogenase [Chloroflexota bacterium]
MADYDIVVLGAGVGGYVAAIRAGQLGMRTAVVERDNVGGICLNWGCIPSKSLLRNAEVLGLVQRADEFGIGFDNLRVDFGKAIDRSRQVVGRLTRGVEMLLRKNKIELIKGAGKLTDRNTVRLEDSGQTLTADNVIIATGARDRELAALPVDRQVVITSREALELREVPSRVVIVGGGATGAEFAYLYRTYGAEVTIVELLPRLVPQEDEEVSRVLQRAFEQQGIETLTGSAVQGVSVNGSRATVSVSTQNETMEIEADKVLVAVGVQGNVEGLGLESLGVETDRGFITIGDTMETSVSGVYAIGDVTGKMLLAHVASAQGVTAVESIAGKSPPKLDYTLMPRAIYCKPQVASFGLTEAQAREQGFEVKIGKFPFTASGKALALSEVDGLVKLVVDSEVGEILGAHMVGSEVTELLGEVAMTRLLEGTTAELGWLVHPHPTISEMLKEAALGAEGEAIHI